MIYLFPFTLERLGLKKLSVDFEKSENDIKALQSVGQIIGEIIKLLDADRCTLLIQIFFSHCQG